MAVLCTLVLATGCASEPERRVHTHPHAGCNTYLPGQVGEHRYYLGRSQIDCPPPLPDLQDSAGGGRSGKVPLTTGLIGHMKLTPDQLANLQFYTSERIVLQRELAGADQYVQGGRLVTRDGRYYDQVVVEKGTPGVATRIDRDAITIDFGQGSPFRFGLPPSPERSRYNSRDQAYRLMAWGWRRGFGKVHYNNKVYRLVGPSHSAMLLIDQDELHKATTQRRVLPGRSLFGPVPAQRYDPDTGAWR